jgi:hypothetical protein
MVGKLLRPLQNPFFRHSGLDPESRKSLKPLDSGFRRNDDIATFVMFCKGLLLAEIRKAADCGGMNLVLKGIYFIYWTGSTGSI